MKRSIAIALAVLAAPFFLVSAQEISLELGPWSKLHYVTYDKKGNVDGFFRQTIQKREAFEGDSVQYSIRMTMFDDKMVPVKGDTGRDVALFSTITQTPDEIRVMIDIKKTIPQEVFDQGATITMDAGNNGVPRHPQVGPLPDYQVKAKLSYQSYNLPIESTCSERAVMGNEKIKTDAGEFDCWRIHEKEVTIVGDNKTISVKDTWYAATVGMVRTVIYSASGKVQQTVELQQADIVPVKKAGM